MRDDIWVSASRGSCCLLFVLREGNCLMYNGMEGVHGILPLCNHRDQKGRLQRDLGGGCGPSPPRSRSATTRMHLEASGYGHVVSRA